jgi:DNA-binding response OmpR family regulator
MRHPGQVLSRGQILDAVWGHDFDSETKVVETYVSSVRRKLAEGDKPAPIETIRNAGYRLVSSE